MKTPAISVVMSVFNGERYLRQSVESILGQTFTDFEFIIVDDGSTDRSKEILESYKDDRIVLLRQENQGVTRALNRGIAAARGAYLARQDADDLSKPERLQKQIAFMEENPSVGLLGTRFECIDECGHVTRLAYMHEDDKSIRARLEQINHFSHGSVMIRREALDAVGTYREYFRYAQDFDLWLRIADKYKVWNLPEFLFCYREIDEAISSSKILVQSLYACVALEMAAQRRDTGLDLLQRGGIPPLPSIREASQALHDKLVTFYTNRPQEMLHGLGVEVSAHDDLCYLFSEICEEWQRQRRDLEDRNRLANDLCGQVRKVLAEQDKSHLQELRDFEGKLLAEVTGKCAGRHAEELKQKDETLLEREETLRSLQEKLESVALEKARVESARDLLTEDLRRKDDIVADMEKEARLAAEALQALRLQKEWELQRKEEELADVAGKCEAASLEAARVRAEMKELAERAEERYRGVLLENELARNEVKLVAAHAAEEKAALKAKITERGDTIAEISRALAQVETQLLQQQKDSAELADKLRRVEEEAAAERGRLLETRRTLEEQLAETRDQLTETREQLAGTRKQLAHAGNELARREQDLQVSDRQLRDTEAQVAAKTEELARIGRKAEELEREKTAERQDLEQRISDKEQIIADILDSKSWRVTAPLRRTFELLRGR